MGNLENTVKIDDSGYNIELCQKTSKTEWVGLQMGYAHLYPLLSPEERIMQFEMIWNEINNVKPEPVKTKNIKPKKKDADSIGHDDQPAIAEG
jgi:hypothetical protein